MLNAQAQSSALQATLKLEGPVCLAGELSALLDGRLQLGATRILEGPDTGGKVSLKAGTVAMLSLTSTGAGAGSLDEIQVRIAGISGDCVTLEFVDPGTAAAHGYRDAIAGGFSDSGNAPLTAATAQYTELLGALQRQSLGQLEQRLLPFFNDLTDYLLGLSSRLKQPKSGENPHYEASLIVRRKGQKIIRDIVQQTADYFQDLTPEHADDQLRQHNIDDANKLELIEVAKSAGGSTSSYLRLLCEALYTPTRRLLSRPERHHGGRRCAPQCGAGNTKPGLAARKQKTCSKTPA